MLRNRHLLSPNRLLNLHQNTLVIRVVETVGQSLVQTICEMIFVAVKFLGCDNGMVEGIRYCTILSTFQ